MERLGILIGKLQEQYQQQTPSEQMLVTIQMIQQELAAASVPPSSPVKSKIAVVLPAGMSMRPSSPAISVQQPAPAPVEQREAVTIAPAEEPPVVNDVTSAPAAGNGAGPGRDASSIIKEVPVVVNEAATAAHGASATANDAASATSARNDAAAAVNDVPATGNNASASMNNIAPARDDASPARNNAFPAGNDVSSSRNDAYSAMHNASTVNDASARNDAAPARNDAFSRTHDIPSAVNDAYAAGHNAAPAKNNASPVNDAPAANNAPAATNGAPPPTGEPPVKHMLREEAPENNSRDTDTPPPAGPVPAFPPPPPPYDPILDVPTLSHQKETSELNDIIAARVESLNEKLRSNQPELGMVLTETPVRDLKKAIGVNDRFAYINELFRGDEIMYERSLKTINNFHIYPEAAYWMERELKIKLGWNEHQPIVKQFYQLVKRRFSSI